MAISHNPFNAIKRNLEEQRTAQMADLDKAIKNIKPIGEILKEQSDSINLTFEQQIQCLNNTIEKNSCIAGQQNTIMIWLTVFIALLTAIMAVMTTVMLFE